MVYTFIVSVYQPCIPGMTALMEKSGHRFQTSHPQIKPKVLCNIRIHVTAHQIVSKLHLQVPIARENTLRIPENAHGGSLKRRYK